MEFLSDFMNNDTKYCTFPDHVCALYNRNSTLEGAKCKERNDYLKRLMNMNRNMDIENAKKIVASEIPCPYNSSIEELQAFINE